MTAVMAGVLAVGMTACASSERGAGGDAAGGTFVFGAAGAPKNFDPIFNDDGESFRPARQMFDTLITHKPGTTELAPGLATEWKSTPDGKTWTFTLREGVTFHDGTPFDATAVCANFDRWFQMKGAAAQSQMIYYGDVFGGFAKNEGDASGAPLYKSCTAQSPNTAVLALNKFKGAFPAAFALPSFSISSPTALKQYDADAVTQSGDSFTYPAYANEHPTGTGPFKFESFDKANNTITLVRNDQYWGEKAKLDRLIFKIIPDENARKQELAAGTIDGYDYPSPADYQTLKDQGDQVLIRQPFSLLYMGINTKNNPKLKDLRVRQALAYAIDRESLVRTKMPEGSAVAKEFVPPTVAGYADDVTEYPYDPEKAKQLLAEAGAQNLTLNFYYPTEITRPYMPNPADLFSAMSANLKAVGITVNPVARPWNGGYKDDVQKAGKHDLHLLGWTGDYNDAGNFVGTFFGREKAEFGPQDPAMFAELAKADAIPDPAGHAAAYQQANKDIMAKYLPAVPILTTGPAIVVGPNVQGLVPSPLTDERFVSVSKN
ncbi:Dipeptide-binding ABC transporter, periplasmic substrate-binding component [Pseudonocardia sp. Ae406_Ps2]|nr:MULTISPECIES: ABC transporter substrate-binding protein [unclassified Pseudonocardia]OLL98838.1 Dipeptide-binding ABC transporter, periplasmic substrate-binding component [Pseudonocardia sp. Ae331_Ps2]OLM03422.1 Dipeptide-binding ABC transporter, periplasmic substrate-binding component [Pseudonocardia sp. Ae406_Ps2]OLM24981.1 Dipeptide-binding ABC transporter, periplasmic substrate-binding component [Pseudonocardia sp. Ae706_Ps2]